MIADSIVCGAWLRSVAPRLDPSLVSSEALHRAAAVADRLPGTVLAALEARLTGAPAPVDLSIRLDAPSQAASVARRLRESPRMPGHIARFLERWSTGARLRELAPELWLEFDLDRPPSAGLPTPTLCARLAPGLGARPLFDEIFPGLHGAPLSAEQQRVGRELLRALPPTVRPSYAFSMLSRGRGDVRLELIGEAGAIATAAGRVAPAAGSAVAALAPVLAGAERTQACFDLGPDGMRPRAGLEGSFRRLPRREPRWRSLLERLEGEGLASGACRRACEDWSGYDTARTAGDWPAGAPRAGVFLARALSHVKLVAEPARPVTAKVYLFVVPVVKAPALAGAAA